MNSIELRRKFTEFFKERGHKEIPSFSLIPQNDASVLFTTAGMHPLVPYLLGKKHPAGDKLVDIQLCLRTDDIDEVGDLCHHTFFEMLGNWSFGDYWKREAINWSYEFLDKELNLNPEKLAVSCFAGDADAPKDEESAEVWRSMGIVNSKIAFLPKKDNWWGPAGDVGPCGPDTEMFYWTGEDDAPEDFQATHSDSRWVEIWNDVFMQYHKTADGKFEALKQKNVDTGMGLERTLAILNRTDDDYQTELFLPIIEKIEEISGKSYSDYKSEFRIIADHARATTFILSEGIVPLNKLQGYVLRRLIRRAIVKAEQIGIKSNFMVKLADIVTRMYQNIYPRTELEVHQIMAELEKEENRFRQTLQKGLKMIDSMDKFDGKALFDLYQSYGIPIEITVEEAKRLGHDINNSAIQQFNNLVLKHQEQSRTASAGMFKGGLADAGEETTKLHTAAHLMLVALRIVLGGDVVQKGSNITAERLRFDFNYAEKMTPEQIKSVEDLVNEKIKADLPVTMEEMSLEEAKKSGAMGVFDDRYGDKVKVYTISANQNVFSREICGGPHAKATGDLGLFKITKEESSSAGVRRIKAILE